MAEVWVAGTVDDLEQHYLEHGWAVLQLPDPSPVLEAREALLRELRAATGSNVATLEQYHELGLDEQAHTDMQHRLTTFFRDNRFALPIMRAQLAVLIPFLGPDLLVQARPYLRITRPARPEDNIGYHRDTHYGGSPFEVSAIVPYVDVGAASSLAVLSGSHVRPESDFPTTKVDNPDPEVTKGSLKHSLGFPYAPHLMEPATIEGMTNVPLKLGEVLLVNLATVHGSTENRGTRSRWTTDIRLLNAMAGVDLSARPDYYEPLHDSVVSRAARAYDRANGRTNGDKG